MDSGQLPTCQTGDESKTKDEPTGQRCSGFRLSSSRCNKSRWNGSGFRSRKARYQIWQCGYYGSNSGDKCSSGGIDDIQSIRHCSRGHRFGAAIRCSTSALHHVRSVGFLLATAQSLTAHFGSEEHELRPSNRQVIHRLHSVRHHVSTDLFHLIGPWKRCVVILLDLLTPILSPTKIRHNTLRVTSSMKGITI